MSNEYNNHQGHSSPDIFEDVDNGGVFDGQQTVFAQMREQMEPDEEVMSSLMSRIAAQDAVADVVEAAGNGAAKSSQETEAHAGTAHKTAHEAAAPAGAVVTPIADAAQATSQPKPRKKSRAKTFFAGVGIAATVLVAFVATMVVVELVLSSLPDDYGSPSDTTLSRPADTGGSTGSGKLTASNDVSDVTLPAEAIYSPGSYEELVQVLGEHVNTNTGSSGIVFDAGPAATEPSEATTVPLQQEPSVPSSIVDGIMDAITPDSAASGSSSDNSGSPGTADGDATGTAPQESAASGTAPAEQANPDFSTTNTQEDGVDEADIVKTDGKNIYVVSDDEVVISKADGAQTAEIARFSPGAKGSKNLRIGDMYIDSGRLVVLYEVGYPSVSQLYSSTGSYDYDGFVKEDMPSTTYFDVYDVSDAAAPRLLDTVGQDGGLESSRLLDGRLYVISERYMETSEIDRGATGGAIEELCPRTYDDAAVAKPLPTSDICIPPEYDRNTYTIVTTYDLAGQKLCDTLSFLGECSTVYMSRDNLYLAGSVWMENEIVTPRDDTTSYRETTSGQATRLTRLSFDAEGNITLAASNMLKGELLNQFSLDEFEGNLRVAFTVDPSHSSIEVINTQTGDVESRGSSYPTSDSGSASSSSRSNAVYILDGDLQVLGGLTGMAKTETIYSVRFMDEVGYVVTYLQTDPLFALDLSDPRNPKVADELKIPGFSEYLHPYADGLLLGLGRTGNSSKVKLSMFDIADPYDIAELNVLALDTYNAPALSNHKAVLIDAERNIIGFAAESGTRNAYFIYGYSNREGFYEQARIEVGSSRYSDLNSIRGLYIGDYLYIAGDTAIGVFNLSDFSEVAWVEL